MPHANRFGERLGNETALTELLGSPTLGRATQSRGVLNRASQPLLLGTVGGTSVRLEVPTPVAGARALSLHEWIPMGALSDRTQCRCCHCGVVSQVRLEPRCTCSVFQVCDPVVRRRTRNHRRAHVCTRRQSHADGRWCALLGHAQLGLSTTSYGTARGKRIVNLLRTLIGC